jgi:hypothetical protein
MIVRREKKGQIKAFDHIWKLGITMKFSLIKNMVGALAPTLGSALGGH